MNNEPRFGYVSEMFAAISTLRIEPRSTVRCDHSEWTGTTHDFPPHLLTCECVNPSHPHGCDQYELG